MKYKGDAHLEKLLNNAGETRSMTEVREIIKGILAAPEDIAAPTLWLELFTVDTHSEAARQLIALKDEMAEEKAPKQHNKLAAMRAEMKKRGIDGFYVTRADEFHGEYVPARSERLAWAANFTGSAGSAVVMNDKAAFFTDGRYTLQARAQVNKADFEICSTTTDQAPTPTVKPTEWIEKNVRKGAVFGLDPAIMSPNEVKEIRTAVEKAGGTVVFVDNPLDAAWENRPAAPVSPVMPQLLQYAGEESEDKRHDLAATLKDKGADALVIALPEETCWLLNVRGGDVPCTPFALSYAIAHKDGTVDWFIDQHKLTEEVKAWVGPDVRIHTFEEFDETLAALAKRHKKIWIDPVTAPIKAQTLVEDNQGTVHAARSPIQRMKALKNEVELNGMAASHIRDGAALTRFLAQMADPAVAAQHDEISASDMLEDFRAENDKFRGLSFDTISGAGANGAIIHYRSEPETKKPITAGPIYLVDSGAQYLDGTTDVTRAIAVGPVTAEMKEHFTRVLKGHIDVAMAEFPAGTCGDVLDAKARASLKEVGLDYGHGTGHGVGSYLSVHEGPCGISWANTTVPLEAGMILSNEPGYYKEGAYGIRIESLVAVINTGRQTDDGKDLLAFKTITMAPIDRNLIEPSLLTEAELKWLNDYHAEVEKNLAPLLEKTDPKAAAFLKQATAPMTKAAPKKAPGTKIKGLFLL